MKYLLPLFCVFLAACETCEPRMVIETKEVMVPVVTRCKVKYPEKPVNPTKDAIPTGLYQQVLILLRENTDYLAYSSELEAALSACADPEK